ERATPGVDASGAMEAGSGAPVDPSSALAQASGAMSEEQAALLYDRIYVGNLKPFYGRIEPAPGVDLFELEDGGNFDGVTLRMRVFSFTKGTLSELRPFGDTRSPIVKIVLAQNMRNEVTRHVRKVPKNLASAQSERLELIEWLLKQARLESWIYDE